MPTPFVPADNPNATDETVANDGWWPDLDTAQFKAQTRLGAVFETADIVAVLQAKMIDVNTVLADWRAAQMADSLDEVPAQTYAGVSEKVILYRRAVYCRARAEFVTTTRDYDTTKSGADQADKLEGTADYWLAQADTALSRFLGRARAVVELI